MQGGLAVKIFRYRRAAAIRHTAVVRAFKAHSANKAFYREKKDIIQSVKTGQNQILVLILLTGYDFYFYRLRAQVSGKVLTCRHLSHSSTKPSCNNVRIGSYIHVFTVARDKQTKHWLEFYLTVCNMQAHRQMPLYSSNRTCDLQRAVKYYPNNMSLVSASVAKGWKISLHWSMNSCLRWCQCLFIYKRLSLLFSCSLLQAAEGHML